MCLFVEKITSLGYLVFRSTTWTNAKAGDKVTGTAENDKSSLDIDPHAHAIKIKHHYFGAYLTVGQILRYIPRHCL